MAVTSVTITSGPTVVGDTVTISGTLARDGGGTGNNITFLTYDSGYVLSYAFPVIDASGPAGSGIAWSSTRRFPNGSYIGVTAYQVDPPYNPLSSATAAIGLIKVVSVSVAGRQPQGATSINWGHPLTRGLVLDWSAANPLINSVDGQRVIAASPSPINALQVGRARDFTNAIDGDTSWGGDYWPLNNENEYTVEAYFKQTAASSYASLLSKFSNSGQLYVRIEPSNAIGIGGNLNGYMTATTNSFSSDTWVYVAATLNAAGLMRTYINGRLIDTYQGTPISSYNNNKFYPDNATNLQVGQSTGQTDSTYAPKADIAFVRLRKVALSASEIWALSQNPWQIYRKARRIFVSFGQSFQFSRPSADLLTGWTRVPASGTHVSAINEITSNQTDYLQANSPTLVDSFTMEQLQQPASGGLDINLDIDASERPVTVDLLNGATVVKTQSVNTTGPATITVTPAELAGVSWPWTPTIRITSQ
jgi:hypothetical protein